MKVYIKKILFLILNFLSNFIFIKKFENKNENILILLQKPLGLGDLVMLSPMVLLIEKYFNNKMYIVSEYDEFIEFKRVLWIKPNNLEKSILKNSIIISPTLTWSHFKYIFKAKYFIGYFISNKFICNIKKIDYKYNPKSEHYLEKTFPILDILKIKYIKNDFIYPLIKTEKILIEAKNYIVIAPYSNWKERQYSLDNYILLIKKLVYEYKLNIIFIGSNASSEIDFNRVLEKKIGSSLLLNLCGKTSILQMNYIIKNAKLFIGNDSGPTNIAYVSAKKTLAFFGSVIFENRLPINKNLKKNIYVLDNRASCKFFPCYDGYNKPKCKSLDQYCCLDTVIEDERLKLLLEI